MISRRRLLHGIAAGSAGVVAGSAGMFMARSSASIRFIGHKASIIALLDSAEGRVLVVLGDRNDDLLVNTGGLRTLANSRIDLIIATHRVLGSSAARKHLQLESTPTLSLQTSSSLPPIRGDITPVTEPVTIGIGDATLLQISIAAPGPNGEDADHPHFLVTAGCHGTRSALASGVAAVELMNESACDLLALPGKPTLPALESKSPVLLVCNTPTDEIFPSRQVQVYRNDPTVVRIGNGNIQLRDDLIAH